MVSLNRTARMMRRRPVTHEGGPAAAKEPPLLQLRRALFSCLLWEDSFYEEGEEIAARIASLVGQVEDSQALARLAVEARRDMKLRHAPLWLVRAMVRHPEHRKLVASLLPQIIERPDEITEFLALYWKEGKTPIAAQVKKGLARSFQRFDSYQLAKWKRKRAVTLKDVMRLVHPVPESEAQSALWSDLVEDEITSPDTWEVALSAGADKKETFERLIRERKLGALAFLQNLRKMQEAGVERALLIEGLEQMNVSRVLPYRFIMAAHYVPSLEPVLEKAMFRAIEGMARLPGMTALLVDLSYSMYTPIAARSTTSRMDVAAGLAVLARELCEDTRIFAFSSTTREVPNRRGLCLEGRHSAQPAA